jgi:aspartyl-tRNA(Asn)/glutamyl-tRNA(Gln) amidotransferase subunit C
MEISISTVEKLAHLARLQLSNEQKKAYASDLKDMVSFVEKLQEVNTTGVDPLLHMGDVVNALRQDEIKGSVSREDALLNAPDKDEAFFKVPKVIKKQ